jgi:hypothetical protein
VSEFNSKKVEPTPPTIKHLEKGTINSAGVKFSDEDLL